MAWYSDEEYELRQDCKEKKSIAASAFKQRTHCGKGGCTLPHEFKTKKELKAMNGEVKNFNLNKPMYWDTFKSMPDDLKKEYINGLREKFDVPDMKIAEMFGVIPNTVSRFFKCYGLAETHKRGSRKWDEDGWDRWRGAKIDLPEVTVVEEDTNVAVKASETPAEPAGEKIDIPMENKIEENQGSSCDHVERKRAVPGNGKMTFDGPIEEIVETLQMLLAGAEVTLDVAWTVVEPESGVCKCPEV